MGDLPRGVYALSRIWDPICAGRLLPDGVNAQHSASQQPAVTFTPMNAPQPVTLYLLCGKIAAGKSTLARQLSQRPATLLIAMDDWMSVLYPTENRTIEDFAQLSKRLRAAMGPHVVAILRQGVSVVMDFPANTVMWRSWLRSLADEAGVAHELHVLELSDDACKARLAQRNASGDHPYQVDEATYDQFMSYFTYPSAEEGCNVVVHVA